jgi:hypothetical protein
MMTPVVLGSSAWNSGETTSVETVGMWAGDSDNLSMEFSDRGEAVIGSGDDETRNGDDASRSGNDATARGDDVTGGSDDVAGSGKDDIGIVDGFERGFFVFTGVFAAASTAGRLWPANGFVKVPFTGSFSGILGNLLATTVGAGLPKPPEILSFFISWILLRLIGVASRSVGVAKLLWEAPSLKYSEASN